MHAHLEHDTTVPAGPDDPARPRRLHYRAPHWCLYVLGVAPARQRQGLGAALLRDLFARGEADGVPTYLEADRPENVPYYQGFGFRVIQESVVPSLPSVTFWHMLRNGAG